MERKGDPDTVTDYPCLYVSEWICPLHVSDIPLEVCQTCIQARRLRMEQNNIKPRTGTTPASQLGTKPSIQRPTPQSEGVEQTTPEELLKRRARLLLNRYIENLREDLDILEKEEPVEREERRMETEERREETPLLDSFRSLSLQLSELENGLVNLLDLIERLRGSLRTEQRKTRTVY